MTKEYERTEVRRRQIADAALDVIAERGLGCFTTKAIAARVGIADGSIFRHFANKQEIVLAAMDRVEDVLFPIPDSGDVDPYSRLEAFFRHRASVIGSGGSIGHLVFSDQLAQAAGEQGWERIRSWRQRNLEYMRESLVELHGLGRLRHGLSPDEVVPIIQGRLLALMLDRSMSTEELPDLEKRISKAWVILSQLLFT